MVEAERAQLPFELEGGVVSIEADQRVLCLSVGIEVEGVLGVGLLGRLQRLPHVTLKTEGVRQAFERL